ncbi:MAG TPA: YceI family protein [Chitinophagaceae bacterium]|nr:YceI family protein [Chitinophagaceae bacterium]
MKKMRFIICIFFLLASFAIHAQGKFYTKSGKISFFSSTPLEDITAVNKSAVSLLDTKTGDLQFAILIKGFEFKKALMQEHFNDKYMESKKIPKAEFKGQVTNNSEINYSANGTYTAKVKGKLTIHGVTKDIETSGTVIVKDGKLTLGSSFNVLVADYNITIEKLHRDNIAKSIRVTVDCALSPM